jgi:hypothetical protein
MAAIDLIRFAFWVQLDTRQVSLRPNLSHSGLPQGPARGAGGQP